ncbi:MAG TPA: NAD(P)/FAD-dependent oxidoreductase [Bryobacteraceae bacterium]|nr:NAD(P)/FAD-dependent oxidoreductase [Bryobacteraceae bacterium]
MNLVDTLIVGAGFSGLCMAMKLREAGMDSFLVIEKSAGIGGTWWENRYPGCACDIPSHLYSFSFDLNPKWSRMFAGWREIQEYLEQSVDRHGIRDRIRLQTKLSEATWDEDAGLWHVVLGDGSAIDARVIVSGMGALHVPHYPEIDGIERFEGPAFHSATWDSSVDLTGKKIAVIGTGASSIQFVPQIAPAAAKLTLFQRTAPWIVPKLDHAIEDRWRKRFEHVPGLMRAYRTLLFWMLEIRVMGFLKKGWLRAQGAKQARQHLEAQVADPKLRAKLTPTYEFGCKRVLISNDFYPALQRPNVELVTEPIKEVRAHSIVTGDRIERPVDVLIYGTGFRVTDMLLGLRIIGRGGIEIHDAWKERVSAYLGITVAGFPNFFLLLGPNTGLGHNSVVLMIEAQVRYVMSCLEMMRSRGQKVMEVRAASQQEFVERIREKLATSVWQAGGCRSWYQDQRTGESPVVWPGSVVDYRRRTRSAAAGDYQFGKVQKG